jgi:hypothetical protein
MKESKVASFNHVQFGAEFENGALMMLAVLPSGEKHVSLDAVETKELADWLNNIFYPMMKSVPVSLAPVALPSSGILPNGIFGQLAPTLVPLEERTTGSMAPKITDAQSVRPLNVEKLVAAELPGGKMESREVNIPVEVPNRK